MRIVKYIQKIATCLKLRGGKKQTLPPKQIVTTGLKERYLIDGWKLHNELAELSGFKWVIDIIDYFSKFMGSFPVIENNAKNILIGIKEFYYYVGFPTIIQTDNG